MDIAECIGHTEILNLLENAQKIPLAEALAELSNNPASFALKEDNEDYSDDLIIAEDDDDSLLLIYCCNADNNQMTTDSNSDDDDNSPSSMATQLLGSQALTNAIAGISTFLINEANKNSK